MAGKVLLLQGPMGPFFSRLASELTAEGCAVFKINFHGGDEADYRHPGALAYTGSFAEWRDYLAAFIAEQEIDRVFLYGDRRPYHVVALDVAASFRIPVYVFEEGYVRPAFVTVEAGGVNGRSSLPRDPNDYLDRAKAGAATADTIARPEVNPGKLAFWAHAWFSTRYAVYYWLGRKRYPLYRHHRPLNPYIEGARWGMSACKKAYYHCADKRRARRLFKPLRKRYFLFLCKSIAMRRFSITPASSLLRHLSKKSLPPLPAMRRRGRFWSSSSIRWIAPIAITGPRSLSSRRNIG
ncbi:hypothetical protein CAI21_13965 [Alkalilimnicola ehrlichii]|uniref:Capsular biosynthesis protein n=1 Tax=Alkalilimnicola ehrlichii TaxID=351052 RepID=A0A3E0WQI3_9GAMM|nr:hypothetical protein CAI21_13965 [Alkalilimnicola ehrlichii]RFA34669.1 hypothetical protein CAL65_15010 [Alkalilimnicola ehrlichii]